MISLAFPGAFLLLSLLADLPFTLPAGMRREDSAIGDYRNKIAKIVEAERVRRAGARWTARYGSWRSGPKEDRGPCFCRGCGLTSEETILRGYSDPRLSKRHLNGLWCLVCMPTEVKMELIDIMVREGIPYDAADHGDE